MSVTSLPLSYTSNHAHQQYYVTSPVALKTTYHMCVLPLLDRKIKIGHLFICNIFGDSSGEETLSAISSLHGHVNQCTIPAKNCPGCHCLCHKHCTTAASLQLKLRMSSECNQIMVYSLQQIYTK